MEIRNLAKDEMISAIKLKISCWTEELAGKAENTLELEKEVIFWTEWMNTSNENNDIRLLLGAFDNSELIGVAFASFIDSKDTPENGIELNGLWICKQHRGKGISLKLIYAILEFFIPLGATRMEVYNHHYAPSNTYYKKLGGTIISTECQMEGKLLVDIFEFNILYLKICLEKNLLHHS